MEENEARRRGCSKEMGGKEEDEGKEKKNYDLFHSADILTKPIFLKYRPRWSDTLGIFWCLIPIPVLHQNIGPVSADIFYNGYEQLYLCSYQSESEIGIYSVTFNCHK